MLQMARSEGFEPPTPRFEVWCSIQLSYERGCCTIVAWRKRSIRVECDIDAAGELRYPLPPPYYGR